MGEILTKNEVYLFAANFLQKLEFLPANSHPLPDKEKFEAQESILRLKKNIIPDSVGKERFSVPNTTKMSFKKY